MRLPSRALDRCPTGSPRDGDPRQSARLRFSSSEKDPSSRNTVQGRSIARRAGIARQRRVPPPLSHCHPELPSTAEASYQTCPPRTCARRRCRQPLALASLRQVHAAPRNTRLHRGALRPASSNVEVRRGASGGFGRLRWRLRWRSPWRLQAFWPLGTVVVIIIFSRSARSGALHVGCGQLKLSWLPGVPPGMMPSLCTLNKSPK